MLDLFTKLVPKCKVVKVIEFMAVKVIEFMAIKAVKVIEFIVDFVAVIEFMATIIKAVKVVIEFLAPKFIVLNPIHPSVW